MSLAVVHTRARLGIEAPAVTVETHLSNGLPGFSMVGLPEAAVRESRDRVRSAIINSRFDFPQKKITVNLAPADLPKEGGRYDLPIALGILAASGQLPVQALENREFYGELALTGALRPVSGLLPAAIAASQMARAVFVPAENSAEAALPQRSKVFAAEHLLAICAHLAGQQELALFKPDNAPQTSDASLPDMADIRGQQQAKRALEIAAAGGHSMLMCGPPGTGKTMLASRLPGILPPMSEDEALEQAAIRSIIGKGLGNDDWCQRPFRSPHHTASAVALVGGGSSPKPGEISLAHHGVLFLDELPEFDRKVLEVLREPLESGTITISRATRQVDYPARFQLIAAMNPCPCGYLGDPDRSRCGHYCDKAERYQAKLSGPLLDRVDIHIEVPPLPRGALSELPKATESSAQIRQRVVQARHRQQTRQGKPNYQLSNREIDRHCPVSEEDRLLLETAMNQLRLSARAFHKILKVARTVADLADSPAIERPHLLEAIGYRKNALSSS